MKSLHIKNFKSIVDVTLNEPNPFTVFFGSNGSGKSNIFEALEFATFLYKDQDELVKNIFDNVSNYNAEPNSKQTITVSFNEFSLNSFGVVSFLSSFRGDSRNEDDKDGLNFRELPDYKQFVSNHSRIFVGNLLVEKISISSSSKLSLSCSNLEKVLKRILENASKKEEISEWLNLFLPEFSRIEVKKSEFSSNENLLLYQKNYNKPFTKDLISDGTYNIIALLTAVLQSDEPQFLCIEEPENGLNPMVVKELVNFFRDACEEKGHYIWLNTHSQTLVSQLKEEEMIVVDKVNGETKIKQFKKGDFFGMPADEALLTNSLGGGLPW